MLIRKDSIEPKSLNILNEYYIDLFLIGFIIIIIIIIIMIIVVVRIIIVVWSG